MLLIAAMITLTTIRRLRDAKLNKNWQFVPGAAFIVAGTIILLLGSSVSYWFLLIPSVFCLLLMTYPSKLSNEQQTRDYILGYFGPIDLSQYKEAHNQHHVSNDRIEPTLVGQASQAGDIHFDEFNAQANQPEESDTASSNQVDFGELIRLKLLGNKKLQIILASAIAFILLVAFIASLIKPSNDNATSSQSSPTSSMQNEVQPVIATESSQLERLHALSMPDNFELYLSQHQGVTIAWQADDVNNGLLWSQLSAKGDSSCQEITFNKGKGFRPLNVQVEDKINYFANFSPLDSQALIKALAVRGNFSLCGYSFSLKGSQAALGKNNQYANLLN